MRRSGRVVVWAGLLALASLAGYSAEPKAVAVSPGSAAGISLIGSRCPTFSWSTRPGSPGSELSLWPVDEEGEIAGPHRLIAIPGDARSWTPSGEQCLEAGNTYAWRVGGEDGWSEPLLFQVAGGKWLNDLLEDTLLEMVEQRRQRERLHALTSVDGVVETASRPSAGTRGHTTGTAGLHVDNSADYGVWASGTSFGIWSTVNADGAAAIYGLVTGGAGSLAGVEGITDSTTGTGVYGFGLGEGVQGVSDGSSGIGVAGSQSGVFGSTNFQGDGCGVEGESISTLGRGLVGSATSTSGTNYGVYGENLNPAGWDFFAAGTGTYSPFTGSHEVRLLGDPATLEPGMVVSATGRAEVRRGPNSGVDLSSTLPTVELSRRPLDRAVLGVFVSKMELSPEHWSHDHGGTFAIVNGLGEGRVWVTDANGPVAAGDYLTTSAIPGFAQRQGDEVHHAYTLAKVTEAVDWDATTRTVEHRGQIYRAALVAVIYTSG